MPLVAPRLAALMVHLLTASGAAFGLLALVAAFENRLPAMFVWLGAALVVDAIDGPLARRLRVRDAEPDIDGDLLDLVVDYLTYVIVPVVALIRSDLLVPALALPLPLIVASLSALYFADRRMKTPDLWFRGFPAIWNVLVFYLAAFRPGQAVDAAVVAIAAAMMFVPVAFLHPMRVTRLRSVTLGVTAVFALAAIDLVATDFAAAFWPRAALALCALWFLAAPLLRGTLRAEGSSIRSSPDLPARHAPSPPPPADSAR